MKNGMAACYPFQWGFSSGIYDAEIHAGIQLLSMLLVEKTFHFFFPSSSSSSSSLDFDGGV